MTRVMRTNHHIGSRIKPKWGKVGSPKSSKRKAWLRKIRKKTKRRRGRKSKRYKKGIAYNPY